MICLMQQIYCPQLTGGKKTLTYSKHTLATAFNINTRKRFGLHKKRRVALRMRNTDMQRIVKQTRCPIGAIDNRNLFTQQLLHQKTGSKPLRTACLRAKPVQSPFTSRLMLKFGKQFAAAFIHTPNGTQRIGMQRV
ncbi:hypothetical protein Barb4_02945 [Bacteroidales bacterium Barb4]|nr:hypothetical protein Barb4_02945 [Bacteroidales bacterium Barb4]